MSWHVGGRADTLTVVEIVESATGGVMANHYPVFVIARQEACELCVPVRGVRFAEMATFVGDTAHSIEKRMCEHCRLRCSVGRGYFLRYVPELRS